VTLGEGVANAIRDLKKEGKLDPNWIWVVRRNGPKELLDRCESRAEELRDQERVLTDEQARDMGV